MINIQKIEIDVGNQGHITNTYLVYDENKKAILIDPADNETIIIENIKEKDLEVEYVLVTHAHGDHIGALEIILNNLKVPVIVHESELSMLLGNIENYCEMLNVPKQNISKDQVITVEGGYKFYVGNLEYEVIHTPGHTKGGVCILEKTSNSLFTGDTIFCDCYGRCDLETANFDDMITSVKKVFSRFEDIVIYPGHGKSVNIKESKKRIRMLMAMKGVKI